MIYVLRRLTNWLSMTHLVFILMYNIMYFVCSKLMLEHHFFLKFFMHETAGDKDELAS